MMKHERCIIIAEAGVNHNGDLELAKKMVGEAKKAGADYIKFQTFVPQDLVTGSAAKAEYQERELGESGSQLDMLKKLALSDEEFRQLKIYCDSTGVGFLSTPFDLKSIYFLSTLDIDFWKIPSGEITNLPYLEKIANTGKKVLLSTGMSEVEEIQAAIEVLEKNGSGEITVLHCNTEYPTPFRDVNLLAMKEIERVFCKNIGYSDHTLGIEVPIAAVALGAKVIEKHFTLNRMMKGPDHCVSLEPEELKNMVVAIRNIETALGDGRKKRTVSEEHNVKIVRKSIVASRAIKAGERYTEDNLAVKRPGTGISPMEWHQILGQKSRRDYQPDELIFKEEADV